MFQRLKIRLYPDKKQKVMLEEHFNGYRYIYNLCLEYKIHMWKYHKINRSKYDMQNELFDILKEVKWLSNLKVECIREAAFDVEKNFKNFYNGKGFPRFKSKKDKKSFLSQQAISCKEYKLKFFKNKIRYKTSESYNQKLENSKIKQIRFIKDKVGDYWASCLIENNNIVKLLTTTNSAGIDLGLKEFIVTSEGEKIPNNKFYIKNQYKLRHFQRKFSKTKKGGKNREKLRIKIAKLYRKITSQREYFFHQVSNKLISENQTIVCETLKISNMIKNRKLSKAIQDVAWYSFIQILEYKCNWYGRNLIKIGTFEPSSKTCSNCGNIKQDLTLADRIYNCNECGFSLDRDHNAAINIKQIGLKVPKFKSVEDKSIDIH